MKVPHCENCEHCEKHNIVFPYLYCKLKELQICVDWKIKTSPDWCPLRKLERGGKRNERQHNNAHQ